MLSVLDGVWVVDEEHRTVFVSRRMAEMLGYVPGDMIGRPACEFCSRTGDTTPSEGVGLSKPWMGHRRLRRKDGAELRVLISRVPMFDENQGFHGALAVVTDLSKISPA